MASSSMVNVDMTGTQLDTNWISDNLQTRLWQIYEKYPYLRFLAGQEVDPFVIQTCQLPSPFDFWESVDSRLAMLDSQRGLINKESCVDFLPYLEGVLPLESSETSSHETHRSADNDNPMRVWRNELDPMVYPNKPLPLHDGTLTDGDESMDIAVTEQDMSQEMAGYENTGRTSSVKDLTREALSKYFYMNITDAAKELNVGVTILKKRCRELGVQRWPRRKLMSLEALIQNVKELMAGEENEGIIEEEIRKLEMEKKKIEEMPDMPLELPTKRLRQNCFKANYKKRKAMSHTGGVRHLMAVDTTPTPSVSSPGSGTGSGSTSVTWSEAFGDEDDDIKHLLYKPDGSF